MELYVTEGEVLRPDRRKVLLVVFFLAGIVSGTLLFNSLGGEEQTRLYIYANYIAQRLRVRSIDKTALFKYVVNYRFRELLVILLLGMTRYRYLFHAGYIFYQGVKNAVLLCIVTVVKGKWGIACFATLVFPQIIVYLWLLCYVIQLFDFEGVSKKSEKIKCMAVVMAMFGLMCLLEAFVNPLLLE